MRDFLAAVALRILGPRSDISTSGDGLANVITNQLPDGAICVVNNTGSGAIRNVYILNKESTAASAPPNIVQPIAGPGRWYLLVTGGGGGGVPTPAIQDVLVAGPTNILDTMNTHCRVNVGSPATVAMPPGAVGKLITVKDASGAAATNNITITSTGTIDGAASQTIATNRGALRMVCVSTAPDVWDIY